MLSMHVLGGLLEELAAGSLSASLYPTAGKGGPSGDDDDDDDDQPKKKKSLKSAGTSLRGNAPKWAKKKQADSCVEMLWQAVSLLLEHSCLI